MIYICSVFIWTDFPSCIILIGSTTKKHGYFKQIIHMQFTYVTIYRNKFVYALMQIKTKFEYYSVLQFYFFNLVNLLIVLFDLPKNIVLCMLHL